MPFKSEAQRRYLWANEPEIARDWADTYGSRIQAASGGISQLVKSGPGRPGYGGPHETYAGGAESGRDPSSSSYSGGNQGGQGGGNPHLNVSNQHAQNLNKQKQLKQLALNQAADKETDVFQKDKPNFIEQGMNLYNQYGLIPNAIRFGQSLFKPKEPSWNDFTKGNPHLNDKRPPVLATSGGGDGQGQQQYYPPWWDEDQYAQSILDDEELDIDTSLGDMEDWIQRYRVKDPYRQDRGALDEQIKEYVSKLYT